MLLHLFDDDVKGSYAISRLLRTLTFQIMYSRTIEEAGDDDDDGCMTNERKQQLQFEK